MILSSLNLEALVLTHPNAINYGWGRKFGQ
jgi:hypothetical protein